MPRKIAVIGASGFVGTRLVEHLVLSRAAEVVPVVRSFSSLAVLARFELPWKVCNVMDPDQLAAALEGCDAVVHAALGDPAQIVKMAHSVYAAAEKAAVKRLVALSSAVVHGPIPAAGTDEQTAIHDGHSMEYSNAKVQAERILRRARDKGRVELVMLRPSIVFGPRSRLFPRIAEQLMNGTAFFVGKGDGICNSIYVDNLIQAIRCSLTQPQADGQVILVGDAERVTWRDIYTRLAEGLGISMATISEIAPPVFHRSFKERVEGFIAKPFAQALLPAFPYHLKRMTKVVLGALKPAPMSSAWVLPSRPGPALDEELATLQQCAWRFPNKRAAEILNYKPAVSFEEGMNRTLSWMKWAGYPIHHGPAGQSAQVPAKQPDACTVSTTI